MEEAISPGRVYIKPTVVLFIGDFGNDDLRDVVFSTNRRLKVSLDSSAQIVTWGYLPTYDKQAQENIGRLVSPFLDLSYWHNLGTKGYVDPDSMPGQGHLPELQVVVVGSCGAKHDSDILMESIAKLGEWVKGRFKLNARIIPILVLISEKFPNPEQTSGYGLHFKLSIGALGGVKVDRKQILEVCQTLLVSLVVSETANTVESFNKKEGFGSDAWVIIGGSAVLADLGSMKAYVNNKILNDFIEPLISTPLEMGERKVIDEDVARVVAQYYKNMTQGAIESKPLSENWVLKLETGGNIKEIQLKEHSALNKVVKAFQEKHQEKTIQGLSDYFKRLYDTLSEGLADRANTHYKNSLRLLEILLNRNLSWADLPPSYLLTTDTGRPRGLRPVSYALESLLNFLRHPDLFVGKQRVEPNTLISNDFILREAEQIVTRLANGYREIYRQKRTIANIFGTIVYLVPAWPLLYGILVILFSLDRLEASVISLALLALLGVVEMVRWNLIIKSEIKKQHARTEQYCARSALKIASRALRDYRVILYTNLHERSAPLVQILMDTEQAFHEIEKELVEAELRSASGDDLATRTIFELADYKLCRDWATRVANVVNADQEGFDSLTARIISEEAFPVIKTPGKVPQLIETLRMEVGKRTEDVFETSMLLVDTLAEKQPELEKGKIWKWLYDQAHPLGSLPKDAHSASFTMIILGEPSILRGGYGKGTKYWPRDAKVTPSWLRNEIQCLRGITVNLERSKK